MTRLSLMLLLVGILLLASTVEGISNHIVMLREQHKERGQQSRSLDDPAELWFTQKVDHFNHQDQRLWQQRYFVNMSSWNKPSGPVFVQIGGEGPISSAYVREFAMSNYAARHGALQLALEHRFYGKSNPFRTFETANMQYLSSQQALADVAYFLQQILPKYFPAGSPAPTVIVFGCSYPGNLAAWFRLKYPNVATGGVSNSSPVRATLDFFQYLDVVDQSLSYFMGPSCDARIQQATQQLQSQLQTPAGRLQVQQEFHTCTVPNSTKDIQTFMSNVIGNWQGTVQYNAEHHNPVTIDTLCDIMENTSLTPLQAYAQVSNMFLEGSCMVISYPVVVAQLREFVPPNAARSWYYQTCTEFGYYQTTDSPSTVQPFGDLLPLSYYTEMCSDVFGFPFVDPTPATNLYYGADQPVGSNVAFVSGSVDPWHVLTVTQNLTESLTAFLIQGTAHCAQLFPASDENNTPPGLYQAQEFTNAQITNWLTNGNPSC